jgi:lipopolysaccharide transport system ATP-binding protein
VVGAYLNSGLGTSAAREWNDLAEAPGNNIVRLRAVRVIGEDGRVTDAVDIRRPVGLEMEYQVLQSGHVLVPDFGLTNQDGDDVFFTLDCNPEWQRHPRPAGHYTSTVWIPGNFLAEGTFIVQVDISTFVPQVFHVEEFDAVAFQVIDSLDGDSARGDFAGKLPGVVRPLLNWNTQFEPDRDEALTAVASEVLKIGEKQAGTEC